MSNPLITPKKLAQVSKILGEYYTKLLDNPAICGTCDSRDPESGFCMRWCQRTESTATCEHWKEFEEDAAEPNAVAENTETK